jgi:hypothetical protein
MPAGRQGITIKECRTGTTLPHSSFFVPCSIFLNNEPAYAGRQARNND